MRRPVSMLLFLLLLVVTGCKTVEPVLLPPSAALPVESESEVLPRSPESPADTETGQPNASPVSLATDETVAFDIAKIEKLGKLVYFHDQLAWKATDILLAEQIDPVNMRISGWITYPVEKEWIVRFFQNDDGIVPLYDVTFPEEGEPTLVRSTDTALTMRDKALLGGRDAAIAAITDPCSSTYNTIVFEMPEEKCIYAYALAASHEPGVIMAGGHYRVILAADDLKIQSVRAFTNACLELTEPDLDNEDEIAGVILSHVLDDTPVETHVFLNLSHHVPLYVITEKGIWSVKEGEIEWEQDLESVQDDPDSSSD